MSNGQRHIIRFFHVKSSGKPPRVNQGNALVHEGDEVVFMATGSDFTLDFPEPELFGIGPNDPIIIGPEYEPRVFTVRTSEKWREFEYSAFCHATRTYVEVNSAPKIIIDE